MAGKIWVHTEPKVSLTSYEDFESLSIEAAELCLGGRSVPVIDCQAIVDDPLFFYRDYVSTNTPVIIKSAFNHWPALSKWTDEYLLELLGDDEISVSLTPDGYADAIRDETFMLPDEQLMKFSEFLKQLNQERTEPAVKSESGIYSSPACYIQKQNSNMIEEFNETLLKDVDTSLKWADQIFGSKPDAVNFWMGDHRAITSLHKDHYENIYCVVRGCKTFTIYPPTDRIYMKYKTCNMHRWKLNADMWTSRAEEGTVPWISECEEYEYIRSRKAHRYVVNIHEGDTLYLPSLWFHHVEQTHSCIAVNYWYDMQYDIKYSYFQFLETAIRKLKNETGEKTERSGT